MRENRLPGLRGGAGQSCPLWFVVDACIEAFENNSWAPPVLYCTHFVMSVLMHLIAGLGEGWIATPLGK